MTCASSSVAGRSGHAKSVTVAGRAKGRSDRERARAPVALARRSDLSSSQRRPKPEEHGREREGRELVDDDDLSPGGPRGAVELGATLLAAHDVEQARAEGAAPPGERHLRGGAGATLRACHRARRRPGRIVEASGRRLVWIERAHYTKPITGPRGSR